MGACFDNRKNIQGNFCSQVKELTVLEVFITISHQGKMSPLNKIDCYRNCKVPRGPDG